MPAHDYLRRILTARVYDVASNRRSSRRRSCRRGSATASAQARGPAAGVLVQVARRLQQDGAAAAARAKRGVICRLGRQPCAGRGAGRAAARLPGGDRDADHHAAGQGRRGARAAAPRWCCTAIPTAMPMRTRVELRGREGLTFVHPFDDPDVIAGQGTIGMEILRQHQADRIDAIFVADRRRRADRRHRRLREAVAPRSGSSACRPATPTRWRARCEAGKRVQLPTSACSPTARRSSGWATRPSACAASYVDEIVLVDTDEICAAIKDVFEDTRSHPRAGGRAGDRRHQGATSSAHEAQGQDAGGGRLRRQHELRPPALRGRARRGRRAARGGASPSPFPRSAAASALLRADRRRAT